MVSTRAARRPLAVAVAILVVSSARAASAQAPSPPGDKVAAQALFEDGRSLMVAGRFGEACPKFAESQRLDPSPSTLLNLANCWEKLGRTATAWATYREAESVASALKRQDYVDTAERHARVLSPLLAHITLSVEKPVDGIQVKRDGVAVGSAEWGLALPIDAGTHSVEVEAPGYKPWTAKADVPRDGAQVTIAVPPLEALPVEPNAASPSAPTATPAGEALVGAAMSRPGEEEASVGSAQRAAGLVAGGAGLVGLGVSGVFALIANGKKQDSLGNCQQNHPDSCNPTGVSQRNDARSAGDAATVAFAVGAVALVAGAAVWLTAPRHRTAGDRGARLVVVPAPGGAVFQGAW